MTYVLILVLCALSAVLGRLVLTRDQAWRTLSVRIPALFLLTLMFLMASFFWLVFGVICFIGGSFYGLGQWWWPKLFEVLDFNGDFIQPIITGRWE